MNEEARVNGALEALQLVCQEFDVTLQPKIVLTNDNVTAELNIIPNPVNTSPKEPGEASAPSEKPASETAATKSPDVADADTDTGAEAPAGSTEADLPAEETSEVDSVEEAALARQEALPQATSTNSKEATNQDPQVK